MAKGKDVSDKDIESKIKDLKLEILKNTTKKKRFKKEIARLLTIKNQNKLKGENS